MAFQPKRQVPYQASARCRKFGAEQVRVAAVVGVVVFEFQARNIRPTGARAAVEAASAELLHAWGVDTRSVDYSCDVNLPPPRGAEKRVLRTEFFSNGDVVRWKCPRRQTSWTPRGRALEWL